MIHKPAATINSGHHILNDTPGSDTKKTNPDSA